MGRRLISGRAFWIGLVVGIVGMLTAFALLPHVELPSVEPVLTEASAGESAESFFIDIPQHGIVVTHGGGFPLALYPLGIQRLDDPSLKRSLAILTKVRNARGEIVGFGAELEVHPGGNLLEEDIEWDTDWILVLPGRGTLYLHQIEHSGELGPKVVGPALASGKPWEGDWTVQTTCGPLANRRGVIVGGTHGFEGATGTFVEVDRLTGFLPEGALRGTIELRVFQEG